MSQPTISIITSAYNAEATVERTIESVLAQTWNNFEYIIVNHGSTDGTNHIIQKYACKDSRIRIIDIEENTGCIGKALNIALKQAIGEYVCFLDADDWLEADYMRDMVALGDEYHADVTLCGFRLVDEFYKTIYTFCVPEVIILRDRDAQQRFMEKYVDAKDYFALTFFDVWWNKLYRRNFLHEHNLFFYETRNVLDDSHFNYDVFKHSPLTVASNQIYINYFRHQQATVFTYKLGGYIGRIEYAKRWNEFFEKVPLERRFYCDHYYSAFHMAAVAKEDLSPVLKEVFDWSTSHEILSHYNATKNWTSMLIPLEVTIRLLYNKYKVSANDTTDRISAYYSIIKSESYTEEDFKSVFELVFQADNNSSLGLQWIADYLMR